MNAGFFIAAYANDVMQYPNSIIVYTGFALCIAGPYIDPVMQKEDEELERERLMPGSSLLSHGETPHYHRRYGVSLLSSAWGQVGPPRYRRQANSVVRNESFTPMLRWLHS